MKVEIKCRWDERILLDVEATSLKEALEAAVNQESGGVMHWGGAYLRGANLEGVNLTGLNSVYLGGADLGEANLRWANLKGIYLAGAYLGLADLADTRLVGADLSGAYLGAANLAWADLEGTNFVGANLVGANLRGTKNTQSMILETGETIKQFIEEVMPALLAIGGHPVSKAAWTCHTWDNCPIAEAFAAKDVLDIPILYRPRVRQFIHYFDMGLIPAPKAK